MGLRVSIYKPDRPNCSNDGLSSRASEATVINIDGPSEPNEKAPAITIEPGGLPGIVRAVPVERPEGHVGPMMGGCYVATSDGRLNEHVCKLTGRAFYGAVALHDRFETPAQYASYD